MYVFKYIITVYIYIYYVCFNWRKPPKRWDPMCIDKSSLCPHGFAVYGQIPDIESFWDDFFLREFFWVYWIPHFTWRYQHMW